MAQQQQAAVRPEGPQDSAGSGRHTSADVNSSEQQQTTHVFNQMLSLH